MYERFVEEVIERAGSAAREDAEHAIAATLEILGGRLRDVDAEAVATRLPQPLATMLLRAQTSSGVTRGSDNPSTTVDMALTRAVCRVLAQTLDEQGRTHLRMQPLSALFC
jgi:uncharacterized protein (DUF2267 family)